ncbi:unnamed protein product, partial [Heterosigma akashiwo]
MESLSSILNHLDEAIIEYLVFRGFTKSIHQFCREKKADKLNAFNPDQVVVQLFKYIEDSDFTGFIGLWLLIEEKFCGHLDQASARVARGLKEGLTKRFLCRAITRRRPEVAQEALRQLAQLGAADV